VYRNSIDIFFSLSLSLSLVFSSSFRRFFFLLVYWDRLLTV